MKIKINWIIKAILIPIFTFTFLLGLYLSSQNDSATLTFLNVSPQEFSERKYVNLTGEVLKPGIYEISDNMRLLEVIEKAGGFTENADTTYISKYVNFSKILIDEENIYIPSISQPSESPSENLIDINKASLTELMNLPGIGESIGKYIIEARPYTSIEELLNVKGIGESKFSKIKDLIRI